MNEHPRDALADAVGRVVAWQQPSANPERAGSWARVEHASRQGSQQTCTGREPGGEDRGG